MMRLGCCSQVLSEAKIGAFLLRSLIGCVVEVVARALIVASLG